METKTGALVCRKTDPNNQFAYKPLAFITEIPSAFTDEDLKLSMDATILAAVAGECNDVLYRADIHATSNEVQEEFEKLHADSGKYPIFRFRPEGAPFIKTDPYQSISWLVEP